MPNLLPPKVKHKAKRQLLAWVFKFKKFKALNTRTEDLFRGPYRLESLKPASDNVSPDIDAMCNAVRQQLAMNPFQGLPPSWNSAIMHIIESHDDLVNQLLLLSQIDEHTASEPHTSQSTPQATPQIITQAIGCDVSADLPRDLRDQPSSTDAGETSRENRADIHKHHRRQFSFDPGDDAGITTRRPRRNPDQAGLSPSEHPLLNAIVESGESSSQDQPEFLSTTAGSSHHPGFPSSTPPSSPHPGFLSPTPLSSHYLGVSPAIPLLNHGPGSSPSTPRSSDQPMTVGGIVGRDFATKAARRANQWYGISIE